MAITNNNVQNVKFLRNQTPYTTREAALTALENNKAQAADGTALLARYLVSGTVKTIVGFVYVTGETHDITIFDTEGASGDVEKLREEINAKLGTGVTSANTATAQFAALSGNSSTDTSATTSVEGAKKYAYDLVGTLDYTDTAVTGSYVSEVNQTDGVIRTTKVALPDASTVSGESEVVIDVTQNKGKITATAANLTGVKLDGLTAGSDEKIEATDTLGEALANIQAQINAMDKTASAEDGKVVTTVTEVDGKVTETKANVKDLQLGGYAKTNDTGDIASADTINVALSKLENKAAAITIDNEDGSINVTPTTGGTDINVNIKSGEHVIAKDGNAGIYTDLDLVKITTGLPETIKERYQLLASDDSQIGANIDIPKDSHIVSINYITEGEHAQNLEYVYIDASGNTQTTYVDMSELVLEAEFASGVTVTNHVAHGVVDANSEKDESNVAFLTVGADGFKVSGIKDAIDTKINKLDVTGDTAVAGQYVAAIQEADGIVAVKTRANVSEAVLNNYSKGSASGAVASTDTVNQAIGKLEVRLDGELAALDADLSGNSTHVTVGVVEENGKLTAVTVSESNIANADDLATLSGKTFTVATSSNSSITTAVTNASDGTKSVDLITDASKVKMSGFTADASGFTAITEATTVTGAVKAIETAMLANEQVTAQALNDLNTRVDDIDENYVETVKVNGVALAETDNAVNVQVSAATSAMTATSTEAIVVDTDNPTGAITIGLAGIDCGYYA